MCKLLDSCLVKAIFLLLLWSTPSVSWKRPQGLEVVDMKEDQRSPKVFARAI
jgi:hypothetical protein